MHLMPELIGN